MTVRRRLLIVEDDGVLNEQYRWLCQTAVADLAADGLLIEATIGSALTYESAREQLIVANQPPDFVSFDLALTQMTLPSMELNGLGGTRLLHELWQMKRYPVAVVVTGENVDRASWIGWQQHGVFNLYQKESLVIDAYINAVKVAMWYHHIVSLMNEAESHHFVALSEKLLVAVQAGQEAAAIAGNKMWPRLIDLRHTIDKMVLEQSTHDKL